ncbi:hypothetical protein ACFO1B_56455 [Dactylosporangium siamense]|nr:hypothetical protein [Dactylosporangium siamense]
MIGALVCGYFVATVSATDWLAGPDVTWAEPSGLSSYTDALPPGAGDLVRFFMVTAPSLDAVVAVTAITVGLRGPSTRLFAPLAALVAVGLALGSAPSGGSGLSARDAAVLHYTSTVSAALSGYLVVAVLCLLFRLHTVYSAMLVLLYAAVAVFYFALARQMAEAFPATSAIHATGTPRTVAMLCAAAAVCALVATIGAALLPKLRRTKRILVLRAPGAAWRAVRDFARSITIGLTPTRDPPGYETRPQFRVLLLCGALGAALCSGALVLTFGVEHPPPAIPGLPTAPPRSPR